MLLVVDNSNWYLVPCTGRIYLDAFSKIRIPSSTEEIMVYVFYIKYSNELYNDFTVFFYFFWK